MSGYDAAFLGDDFEVPLPTFTDALLPNVLEYEGELYTHYIHFSLATNCARRQPIVVALNIDQKKIIKVDGERYWKRDPKVGEYQLGAEYYKNNPIDRGHLARRATAAWGDTEEEAQAAGDATNIYSNCALQHKHFNQDEWLALEDWVWDLELDGTDKISVFSGPIYTTKTGINLVVGEPMAIIPTAFFKVVCFIDKEGQLATRAFVVPQDYDALNPQKARRNLDLAAYQVPVRFIEDETGLVFDGAVRDANPMQYDDDVPQIMPVCSGDLRNEPGPAVDESPFVGVSLQAVMVDPEGSDTGNEWVLVGNYSEAEVDLAGWSIVQDGKCAELPPVVLAVGETQRFSEIDGLRLRNSGGTIALIDADGRTVHRAAYTKKQVRPGFAVMFPRVEL